VFTPIPSTIPGTLNQLGIFFLRTSTALAVTVKAMVSIQINCWEFIKWVCVL
jgi:hypothetical protein